MMLFFEDMYTLGWILYFLYLYLALSILVSLVDLCRRLVGDKEILGRG